MGFEQFVQDDKTSSAVLRKLEVMGGAAKHVPDEMKERYPAAAWREMAGMRDKLICGAGGGCQCGHAPSYSPASIRQLL